MRRIHEESIEDDVPYLKEDSYFEFSEKYLWFKGKLFDSKADNTMVNGPLSSTCVPTSGRPDITVTCDAKLPKISMPKFSGEYMEWISFRGIYSTLVHNND